MRASQQSDPHYHEPPPTTRDLVGDIADYIDTSVLAEALVEEVVEQAGFIPTANLCREVWLDFLYCLHEYLRAHARGMITTPEYNAENDEFLAGRRREPDPPLEDPEVIGRRIEALWDRWDKEEEHLAALEAAGAPSHEQLEYEHSRRALEDAETALGEGRDPFPDDPEDPELRLSILRADVEGGPPPTWCRTPEEGGPSPLPPDPFGLGRSHLNPLGLRRSPLCPPAGPPAGGPGAPPTPDESCRALESEGDQPPPPIRIRWVKCGEVHVTIDPKRVAKLQYMEVPDEEA